MVSQEDQLILQKFRDSIEHDVEEQLEDYLLIVYLRASNMDVKRSKELIKRFIEIRNMLTDSDRHDFRDYISLEEISSDIRYKFLGADSEGRLVYWVPAGRWNARTHIERGLKKELFLHCFKCAANVFYQLYEQGEKTGKHQSIVVIGDFQELTLHKITHYETLQTGLSLLNDLQILSSLLHKFYIVNGPWVMNTLVRMVKPFLYSSTTKKLQLLNQKQEEWKQILRTNIPIQILPKEYGGNGPSVLIDINV